MKFSNLISLTLAFFSITALASPGLFPGSDKMSNTNAEWEALRTMKPSFVTSLHNGSFFNPARASAIFNNLPIERSLATRGAKEISLYASLSSAVVLIITDDGFGTGTLISKDGLILTNNHVIAGYESVGVLFKPAKGSNKVKKDDVKIARVIRVDEIADLALLRLTSSTDIPKVMPLGSINEIEIGSDVHAIGHPAGADWSYTKGLVSQIRKEYKWITEQKIQHQADVIQTQTPINPGNSGGPLISDRGRMIGVNSFKSEGEALNYAISIDEVERFLKSNESRYSEQPKVSKSPEDCNPREGKRRRNEESKGYTTLIDLDCDDEADAMFVEPFDKSLPFRIVMDKNGDGKADIYYFDEGRDGKWDYSLYDTDFDGKTDVVGIHTDGSITPTRYEPYEGS